MEEKGSPLSKYDGKDFPVWKAQVEAYLTAKGWWYIDVISTPKPRKLVSTGTKEEQEAREQEILSYERGDKLARSIILLALDNKNARLVLQCETARDMWERVDSVKRTPHSAHSPLSLRAHSALIKKNSLWF